jgi:hypothetical protein
MLSTPVDPGVRYRDEFGPYVRYSPPSLPCRFFSLFLAHFYNAVAIVFFTGIIDNPSRSG